MRYSKFQAAHRFAAAPDAEQIRCTKLKSSNPQDSGRLRIALLENLDSFEIGEICDLRVRVVKRRYPRRFVHRRPTESFAGRSP